MRIELDDSIPENVKKHCRWAMQRACQEIDDRPTFALQITPPMPKVVDFSSPLSDPDRAFLVVHIERRPLRKDFGKWQGDQQVGYRLSMNPHDARLAREFIEKHYG